MVLENGRSSVYNLVMPRQLHFEKMIPKIKNFYWKRKRLPSFSELQTLLDYRSKGGVSLLVERLIEKNILKRDETGRLLPTPCLQTSLKWVGSIQAGFPSPAEEELLDTLSLDEFLISKPEASYLVKVTGDSMIDAGIRSGDFVIVQRGREPRTGDIVIAQIDGEWTMKFFEKERGKIVLRAGSKRYSPTYPKEALVIGGVVVANIRKYH